MANGICMPAGSTSKSTTSASTKPQKHNYLSGRGARGVPAVRAAMRGYRLAFGANFGCAEPWWHHRHAEMVEGTRRCAQQHCFEQEGRGHGISCCR